MTDILFHGGDIVTMDSRFDGPEAVLVRGSRIHFVGTLREAKSQFHKQGTIVDLKGRVLLPGFIDAHSHPLLSVQLCGSPVVDIRARTVPTYEAILEKIKRRVAVADPNEHLMFFGLDAQLHDGMEAPSRAFLDELAPHNPLAVQTSNLHAVFMNSAGFDVCGIDETTPTPVGGVVDRDPEGRPTGRIAESTIFEALHTFYSSWGDERLHREFSAFIMPFIESGITTTTDHLFQPYDQAHYSEALDAGFPLPRLAAYQQVLKPDMHIEDLSIGDDRLWMAGVKIHADGSPFVGNIWVSEPYLENSTTLQKMNLRPGHTGEMNYSQIHLKSMIEAYHQEGRQIAVHAQGDRSIDVVLDIFEDALKLYPRVDHRFRLEHCALMRDDQIERAMRLGVLSSFFINHITHWGGPIEDVLFGPDRASKYMPVGAAVDAGMRISLHADTPMTEPSALALMQAAMTRETADGRCLGPDERITASAALKAVTIDAAYQIGKENVLGSITPGKHADLVVLAENPLTIAPGHVAAIKVEQTILAGQIVWDCG